MIHIFNQDKEAIKNEVTFVTEPRKVWACDLSFAIWGVWWGESDQNIMQCRYL